jgi:hypothetical protein
MARAFDITTTSPTLKLGGNRKGEVAFTVTNSLGHPVRGRAVIVPEGATPPEWLSLGGDAERDFPANGTHVYQAQVAVPPSQAAGEHAFHLLVADQSNPDEYFAESSPVAFKVPAPVVAPRRKIPWWIPVAAVAGVLLIVLVGVLLGRDKKEEPGTGGSGGVTQAEPPPPAPVLAFNGTTSYVDLGQPLSLEVTGPITLEAWIRPVNSNGIQDIVARGYISSPSGEVFLRIVFGSYQAGSYMEGRSSGVTSASMPLQDVNNWVHVAGVYDGEKWRLFRNGELQAEAPQPDGGGFPINARWAIGSKGGGGDRTFNGNIRDVRIWSVARTQAQIGEDMKEPPDKDAEGLAGYWPLDEGRASRIKDHSGNEAHGFIHGAQWAQP